jgi:hypothetical protein
MRGRPALAAAVLALASGIGLVLASNPAHAAPFGGTLTVKPQLGPPDTQITARFQWNATNACPKFNVIFKWDGHQVGSPKPLDHCVAALSFRPPRENRGPGPHSITAGTDNAVLGQATFFVVGTRPSDSPPPSQTPSATPTKSKGTKASPSPSGSDVVYVPPTYDTPTQSGSVDAAGAGAGGGSDSSSSSGGGGMSPIAVALAFGGALVLGGVLILGYIVFRGRRDEPEPAFALAESPTQPIQTGFPRSFLAPPVDPYHVDPSGPPPVPD